jgi:hypothetical protein
LASLLQQVSEHHFRVDAAERASALAQLTQNSVRVKVGEDVRLGLRLNHQQRVTILASVDDHPLSARLRRLEPQAELAVWGMVMVFWRSVIVQSSSLVGRERSRIFLPRLATWGTE